MDDEREIVRRRMEVVIYQALGNIEGTDIGACELSFGNKFMHADTVEWDVIRVAQAGLQIVRVQNRILRNILQAIRSMHGYVGICTNKAAAEVTVECFHASNALFGSDKAVEGWGVIVSFFHYSHKGSRQKIYKT